MSSEQIFAALALMLLIEGLLPLLNPTLWRQVFARMLAMTDGQIRFVGLASILSGTLLLLLVWN
ncbi:uncharacterized protein YjeT (DUF2065 family) [Paucibacter oligotrophus]|uniref:Uncharacterized protein YjeT (DUF2065 family) n=1 Tax=Roseateles oligotrophus TaxID=1769250 RepID=A0A840L0Z1_9BURK|nr:uncharacterized protein YjeT (DUF2065 family) [Roseateles oligotrophus]